jgi:peptide/nickel transport system permease protein
MTMTIPATPDAAPDAAAGPRTTRRFTLGKYRSTGLLIGVGALAVWAVAILLAPYIAPFDPLAQTFDPLTGPSAQNWFGTDELGRDVFSRVLYGSRISVVYGIILVACSAAIGTVVGLAAGFFGGWVDEVLMRLVDLVFAFPVIILAMAIAASLGANLRNSVIAGVIVSWPIYARTVRGLVVGLRESDFVLASRLSGTSSLRSIRIDVMPSVAGPVLVLATQEVGGAILLLAGLSFLGLGAQPPLAEWGSMIAAGANHLSSWWIAVFPGLAILTVALAFNLIGDSLRDILDPRTKRLAEARRAS